MNRVGFLGSEGKVGKAIIPLIKNDLDFDFVIGVNKKSDLHLLVEAKIDICIDFTSPNSVLNNVLFLIENNINAVVGTTGLKTDDLKIIENALENKPDITVIIVPNFSIGAILATKLAKLAGNYFETIEIVEGHNELKKDSPSGTAINTAEEIAKSLNKNINSSLKANSLNSLPRGEIVKNIPIHSIRSAGMVAHESIILGNPGEILTIKHDSISRESFWYGIRIALLEINKNSGLIKGIDKFI